MTLAIDINDVIRDNMYQFRYIYQKYIDGSFEINLDDIDTYNMLDHYPFESETELNQFKYLDYPFELYGRAETCDKMLAYRLNDYLERTLKDLDVVPNVILFSPFEVGLTIQSTFSFLACQSVRAREIYFPIDSMTIYNRADVVITAQPSLIENCPENKTVIKVVKPYNKDIDTKYSFDSMMSIIDDPNETLIKIIENNSKDQ
jgi:hypothetical protein